MGATPEEPRLQPLPVKEWPESMREALAALRPAHARHPIFRTEGRPKGLNALGVLARHPDLTRSFNTFNGHLLYGTTLSPRQRELLVLRVAALRNSAYEWAQHEVLAVDVGFTADDIAHIAEGTAGEGWPPLEVALLTAVDELLDDALVTDATWKVLAAELDDQQLMDVVFTVGAYDLLAMAFRTLGVQLDDDLGK